MTGYGRGECTMNERRFKVEIKSVNHRYGDISIKLPRFLNAFEDGVRKRLSREILRGKADVYIHFETQSARDVSVRLNTAFAEAYVGALRELQTAYGLTDGVTLPLLTSNHEIFSVEKDSYDEAARAELLETLNAALDEALSRYNEMRVTEGESLRRDMLLKRENMQQTLARVKERAPAVSAEYAKRLRERISEALSGTSFIPDEGRLLTEIAIFADRSCVDEEITRLESHLSQLDGILSGGEAAGRKLDFLVQELNREVNTIGSKSNDAEMTGFVLSLKAEIEKIREQIQNIE
jgi:uncharacterized protein (TIGR00255 family)